MKCGLCKQTIPKTTKRWMNCKRVCETCWNDRKLNPESLTHCKNCNRMIKHFSKSGYCGLCYYGCHEKARIKEYHRKYYQKPEVKKKQREYKRKRRAKLKEEGN